MPQWSNIPIDKIIIVLLIVGTSVASWAYRQFKQYQTQKQIKDAETRRREQMLRTGRVEGGMPAPSMAPVDEHELAKRRLQELVEQRRREMQAMAQRQAGGEGSPGMPPAAPPASVTPPRPMARPVARQGGRPQAPSTPPTPVGTPRPQQPQQALGQRPPTPQSQTQNKVKRESQRKAEKDRAERARQAEIADRLQAQQAAAAAAAQAQSQREAAADQAADRELNSGVTKPARPVAAIGAGPLRLVPGAGGTSAEQLRRSVALMELLGPPVSLRPPDQRAL